MKNLKSLYTCAKNKNILNSHFNAVSAEGILEPSFEEKSDFRYRLVNSERVILLQAPEYLTPTMRRFLWEPVFVKGFLSESDVFEVFKISPKRRLNESSHSLPDEGKMSWRPLAETLLWPTLDEPA